jgi:tetratricopeptide (TPR) repeat protein
MRHAPLFLSIAIALVTFAGGAHDATAQMPTAEEMQEMQKAMEEAQKQMEQMDPATRKQLEDLMAHPPAGAAGGSVSEAPPQVAGALDSVSRDPLDDDDLREFVEDLQPKLSEALSADARSRAQAIDAELQKYPDYPGRLRAAANGLAAWGVWPEAIWLSGRLAVQSGSAQDLSNLAAMLVMERAPGAALPILYSLDARYPGNTTVQNNIAQALYGAGDSEAAEEQLKAVIAAAPIHPQANATLALIQAARGDTAAAQESMRRATRGGFSPSKETELRKMGAELRAQDVAPLPRMPQDPLGLHRV